MKKILVTGKNSYVGNSFVDWAFQFTDDYIISKISMRDNSWRMHNFSSYDTIIHVAGIAHVSRDPRLKEKYYFVNSDLAIEVAKKAKQEGVKQFIFLSSIIVYGNQNKNKGQITLDTLPEPDDFYGDSKLRAEKGIACLDSEGFKVVIIRPPMIYGKGSKGNFPKLIKISRIVPFFPLYENKRSMLYIDNLSEFLRLIIQNEERGIFFPQNKEYINTSELIKEISIKNSKKLKLLPGFNGLINLMKKKSSYVNKIFGDLYYIKEMSDYKDNYQILKLSDTLDYTKDEQI